jgi:uncharacterized protein (DUF2267 family)
MSSWCALDNAKGVICMTLPASLGHAVQLTQQWLKELRDNGNLDDEAAALSALRAVMHQLRDRVTPEEAVDLAAQLPLIVRGIYFEAWRPARTPEKLHTKEEFIDGVAHKLRPHPIAAEAAVRDDFQPQIPRLIGNIARRAQTSKGDLLGCSHYGETRRRCCKA